MYLLPLAVGFVAFVIGEASHRSQAAGNVAAIGIMTGLVARFGGSEVTTCVLLSLLAVVILFSPSWVLRFMRSLV